MTHESRSSTIISKLTLMTCVALHHVSRGGYQGDSIKNAKPALASETHLVGASSHTPKGCRFNYQSEHMGGNRSMFLFLPSLLLSLKSIKINKTKQNKSTQSL